MKITELKDEQKKAEEKNVKVANEILKSGKLKTFVDKLMSSVNKSTKEDVKDVANKLIGACTKVAEILNKNTLGDQKMRLDEKIGISREDVEKFDSAHASVLGDLSESDDKKEKKLATSMSNAFPHWCLELAYKLQESNFYKRLHDKNDNKDTGEKFKKTQENKGSFHKLQKKWKNLFSGKARKHETFEKMRKLIVKYSEPWAIAWVNAAKNGDPISESSAIKEINALCKKKDVDFISNLGDKEKFKLAESFNSIFGKNFENNSGKIKKSLKSIIDRLVSISKKLTNKKYKEKDQSTISEKIKTYNQDAEFKKVMQEQGILSKAWGKITAAASTVGGGIKTAGGKVLSGAEAVGSGIAKGGKLLGKGALKVATSPKYLIPEKWRNKIYDKLEKIFTRESEINEFLVDVHMNNMSTNDFNNLNQNLSTISNSNISQEKQQEIISNNIDNLTNSDKITELLTMTEKEKENKEKEKENEENNDGQTVL